MKKTKIWIWGISIIIVVIFFVMFTQSKVLPPTTSQGHIEGSPSSQVLNRPMSIPIHKHMLEHVEGKGRPGVIINYNCADYDCDNNLIDKLANFTNEFNFVYVAPFPNMDAKIALTKLGEVKVLDEYDEDAIRRFIKLS